MREVCSLEGRRKTKHQAVSRGLHAIARGVTTDDRIDLWEFNDVLDHVGSTSEPAVLQHRREAVENRSLPVLVRALTPPRGGREVGAALFGTIAGSDARDILLITDGKSFALDVQALARYRRRVCVVLIGEDSLEANVGHLSALTGGEIFVAAGNDLTAVLAEALRSLRVPCSPPEPVFGVVRSTSARRGGMTITASWSDNASPTAPTIETRGVAAVAASLLLPALTTEDAAALAEDEGLVTHLTSLVLVGKAGDIQQTVPAMRKVPLPSPRTHMAPEYAESRSPWVAKEAFEERLHTEDAALQCAARKAARASIINLLNVDEPELLQKKVGELVSEHTADCLENANIVYIGDLVQTTKAEMLLALNFDGKCLYEIKHRLDPMGLHLDMDPMSVHRTWRECRLRLDMEGPGWPPEDIEMRAPAFKYFGRRRKVELEALDLDLSGTMQAIDWDRGPEKLRSGDLSMLVSAVEQAIQEAASNKDVVALARTLDLDPVVLIVGLLAHAARSHPTAARIAHAIFGGEPPAEMSAVLRLLGIERLAA